MTYPLRVKKRFFDAPRCEFRFSKGESRGAKVELLWDHFDADRAALSKVPGVDRAGYVTV